MVLLGFTKLKDKLLDGSKRQTIRLPRKRPFKVGDELQVYWKLRTKQCEKLFDAIVTKVERKRVCDLTLEDMKLDGFDNDLQFYSAWTQLHRGMKAIEPVDIISFNKI